jgi:hypothetical protein
VAQIGKIAVGILAAIAGFLAVTFWGPFKGEPFDYAAASVERKQKYLETKAQNISRGYRLTAGDKSEITQTYVDAESDMISFTIELKGAELASLPASEVENAKNLILKTVCKLTERKLLTETAFRMRMRFFRPGGGSLMTVEANGETCAPHF